MTKHLKVLHLLFGSKLTLHFEFGGRQGHHSVMTEDFCFRKDETGASKKVFVEEITQVK